MSKCLFCYLEFKEEDLKNEKTAEKMPDFHPACSKKIFGTKTPPILPYTKNEISELALDVIRSHTAVTGAQPKLSLDLEKGEKNAPKRFTIAGLWGKYILKPQTEAYQNLPEFEDLTMHLAELSKIKVVPHSLIRFEDGSLCYITKRIDRDENGIRINMEDMCQLTKRLTEDKYKGSYEQIAKQIQQFSETPGLDLIDFASQLIFCFLTGNSDMHLKNFSLIEYENGYKMTEAYDMLPTNIILPEEDTEETALLLNGIKKKITKEDFEKSFQTMKIDSKSVENIFKNFKETIPMWFDFIDKSFLPDEMKEKYKLLIKERAQRLELLQLI
ncbi:hypothetical protein MmiHf6_02110 [Methanimicrococcus hongohii]|uniref:HipA-like C-terminal domain-containing protein n=1 Tax=Methanimicrococcus hongohii TaxID=3028295 RepID=A0AA96UYH2_9EURY|nr:HipA domain-containing protein [Methanimicrococcus sp. Hf6]WNY22919.1 hypothetical protein MmiHf6_02110 [Methanimicrococcus sp. Hf6]